jgi:hypothetical protein
LPSLGTHKSRAKRLLPSIGASVRRAPATLPSWPRSPTCLRRTRVTDCRRWPAILFPHWFAGCDKEDRTTTLPSLSQERFRYQVRTTDGDSGTRNHQCDSCDRECSRPLPNEFHADFEGTHFPRLVRFASGASLVRAGAGSSTELCIADISSSRAAIMSAAKRQSSSLRPYFSSARATSIAPCW